MKPWIALAAVVISCWAPVSHAFDPSAPPIAAQGTLQPLFSPWDDIESVLVDAIEKAREQVLVQAYLLTSERFATALVAARRRGIDVRVLADATQAAGKSRLLEMSAAGIPVWLETQFQHAHNKVIVIDAHTSNPVVMTGSFNFTWSAQHRNAENVLVVRDNPVLASRYASNWERHRRNASPYQK